VASVINTTNAEGGTAHTTAPVTASSAPDAEFCDSPGAKARFGLGRTYLYQLLEQGLIEGVSLRKKGAQKGKRLWGVDSIRRYLRSQMEAGN
jgi:hypothetical protein